MNELIANSQRDILRGQWDLKCLLSKRQGEKYVYTAQKELAEKIVSYYDKGILMVTLCAPPQWGKTGVSLGIAYKLCTHIESPKMIGFENVFFITGMSDTDWVNQTTERVLESWKPNVYHRNKLHLMKEKIECLKSSNNDKNIFIIIDECHIANHSGHMLSRMFQELGLMDIESMKQKNIKILQISATPSNALVDAGEWNEYHTQICPYPNDGYVSFQTMLDEGRLRDTFDLCDKQGCQYFMKYIELFSTPKYHFIRGISKGKHKFYSILLNNFKELFPETITIIELNSTVPKSKIQEIYENLNHQPDKHTIIFIKDMLGASKTIPDTHIGCVHESSPSSKMKDYCSEAQGLAGRLCGWNKQRGLPGMAPIVFCNVYIIEQYIRLFKESFNIYADGFEWIDGRMKKRENKELTSIPSYVHHSVVKGVEPPEIYESEPIIMKFYGEEGQIQGKDYYVQHMKGKSSKWNGRGPNKRKPKDGMYETTIREGSRVYSSEEMYNERKCNIDNGAGYGFRPCYENVLNRDTLQWWMMYYD
jgi:hypothetical protein